MASEQTKLLLRKWGVRAAIVLAFVTLAWWTALTKRQPRQIKSLRPNLADIKFKPVTWRGNKGWVAKFEIDVDISKAWPIMRDCLQYYKVIKGMRLCEKAGEGRDEQGKYIDYKMDLHSPRGGFMHTRAYNEPAKYFHHWVMLKGSPVFKKGKGYARLYRHPKNPKWTMVDYGYFVRLKHWLFKIAPGLETDRVFKAIKRMAQEIQEYFSPEAGALRAKRRLQGQRQKQAAAMKPMTPGPPKAP